MQRFHAPSKGVMVATPSLARELAGRGIGPTRPWSRGIDPELFSPVGDTLPELADLPRPILLNVGRVAPEKNLEAFLNLDTPGTKVVAGDGPALAEMQRLYPDVVFLGALAGERLAQAYRAADVFVFPSRTDTFGLVIIEALACGLPVASYPVSGPLDILGEQGRGWSMISPPPSPCWTRIWAWLSAARCGSTGRRPGCSAAASPGRAPPTSSWPPSSRPRAITAPRPCARAASRPPPTRCPKRSERLFGNPAKAGFAAPARPPTGCSRVGALAAVAPIRISRDTPLPKGAPIR
jgi:hypothetical protein